MKLLTVPLDDITFDDIVAFCGEGNREGIQLDYKRDLPKQGLSKHFASFSNTRGGLLILGVTEDRTTGLPSAWDGIDNSAKSVEMVHQWASSVTPVPSYDLHVTNDVKGKVFIVVRINEGAQTPYYVHNDANIWVRTGNISNPIEIASPDWVELLIGKKEKAKVARENYSNMASIVYKSAFENAEIDRKRRLVEDREDYERRRQASIPESIGPYKPKYYAKALGSQSAMCTVELQPFYPNKVLESPRNLKENVDKIRDAGKFRTERPSLNMRPIPEGVYTFDWDQYDGTIECEQLYSKGMVYLAKDILSVDENDSRTIRTQSIVGILFIGLQVASNYYKLYGYQGGVFGKMFIEGVRNVSVFAIEGGGMWRRDQLFGKKIALLNRYEWELELDTVQLFDAKSKEDYFVSKAMEIEWDLGYPDTTESLVRQYLKANHWLVE